MIVTVACPELLVADANQLALIVGLDDNTFGHTAYVDNIGNLYSVASCQMPENLYELLSGDLSNPAALRARDVLRIWTEENPVLATPNTLSAVSHYDGIYALQLLGLSPASVDFI